MRRQLLLLPLAVLLVTTACSSPETETAELNAETFQQGPTEAEAVAWNEEIRTPSLIVSGRLEELQKLNPEVEAELVRVGNVQLGDQVLTGAAVSARLREYTPEVTARSDAVWEAIRRGEALISHAAAERTGLELGETYQSTNGSYRIGAKAESGIPGVDVLIPGERAEELGEGEWKALIASENPEALEKRVGELLQGPAQVQNIAPSGTVTYLTGTSAAAKFGKFEYSYRSDGTIQPDAEWVRENIITTEVPIIGRVTCHKLMVPQMRKALAEIEERGLASTLNRDEYAGCYVPRFIGRDPSRPVSLHTWGIAFDVNVPGNLQGTEGTLHPEVVQIFKKWGFSWGGDWSYTDPMHFELNALLEE